MLKCADDSYYVGSTRDLDARAQQHTLGGVDSYTASRVRSKWCGLRNVNTSRTRSSSSTRSRAGVGTRNWLSSRGDCRISRLCHGPAVGRGASPVEPPPFDMLRARVGTCPSTSSGRRYAPFDRLRTQIMRAGLHPSTGSGRRFAPFDRLRGNLRALRQAHGCIKVPGRAPWLVPRPGASGGGPPTAR
jgi:hypothetical protein